MGEALTALLSVVIGAVIALIGNYLVSKRTAEMQMKTTVLSSYFAARVDAFKECLVALENWSNNRTVESCAGVYRAANFVSLVASEETRQAMNEVQEAVREFELNGIEPDPKVFQLNQLALLIKMQADLMTYQVPEIRINKTKTENKNKKQKS